MIVAPSAREDRVMKLQQWIQIMMKHGKHIELICLISMLGTKNNWWMEETRALENLVTNCQLPYFIVQTTPFMETLYSLVQNNYVPFSSGISTFNMIAFDDVVEFVVKAIQMDHKFLNSTMELTGPELISKEMIAKLLTSQFGKEIKVFIYSK